MESFGDRFGDSSQHVDIVISVKFSMKLTVFPAVETITAIKADMRSVFTIDFKFFKMVCSFPYLFPYYTQLFDNENDFLHTKKILYGKSHLLSSYFHIK